MNYEQRYNDALARAKEQLDVANVFDYDNEQIAHDIRNTVYNIFPELKENKKEWIEKIRQELKSYLGHRKTEQISELDAVHQWIAWLEKQGEQKPTWSEEDESFLEDVLWCCKKVASIAKDENEMGTVWYAERWLNSLKDRCTRKPTEKQGEQKPFDYENANQQKDSATVKTKFNKGDWIVDHYNHVARIKSIDEKHYDLSGDDGSCERWSFMYIDRNWRLWTIKDAKDGDVLHSSSHHLIWIYKDCGQYYACVNMNYTTENVGTDGLISIPDDVCPATKDEQTILFAKMKEAGYEWNADKKKLINIL